MVRNLPSPVTFSPLLMLGLEASLDFKSDSNRFNPSRNLGFNLSLELLMSCIMSSSLEGAGRAKASNPEKRFNMLSVIV